MAWKTATAQVLLSSETLLANREPSSHCPFQPEVLQVPADHQTSVIFCKCCDKPKLIIPNCGNRLCPYCRNKVVNRTLNRRDLYKNPPSGLRFMTLTIKSVPTLDRKSIDTIRGYFRKLIRRKVWKRYVKGGLYVIECTKTNAGYHLHLHILYQGEYFPYRALCNQWKEVSEGSYICWISKVKDSEYALGYVLKYVSKVEKSNIPAEEYLKAFKGIKLVQMFGTWTRGSIPREKAKCRFCGNSKFYYLAGVDPADIDFNYHKEIQMDKEEDSIGLSPPIEEYDFEVATQQEFEKRGFIYYEA